MMALRGVGIDRPVEREDAAERGERVAVPRERGTRPRALAAVAAPHGLLCLTTTPPARRTRGRGSAPSRGRGCCCNSVPCRAVARRWRRRGGRCPVRRRTRPSGAGSRRSAAACLKSNDGSSAVCPVDFGSVSQSTDQLDEVARDRDVVLRDPLRTRACQIRRDTRASLTAVVRPDLSKHVVVLRRRRPRSPRSSKFFAAARTMHGPPMSMFSIASASVTPGFATVCSNG